MSIQELAAIITPPAQPLHVGDETAWRGIEHQLGTTLPNDYFQYAITYGSGRFLDLDVANPFDPGYLRFVDSECRRLRDYKEDPDDYSYVPYNPFPAVPGLFPVAIDSNDEMVWWLTRGPANEWPIFVSLEANDWRELDLRLTEFLTLANTPETKLFDWWRPWYEKGETPQFIQRSMFFYG